MTDLLDAFVPVWRRERGWTRRLVAAIPEQHLDWRPAVGSFSLLDLVRHLVQSERFWATLVAEAATGRGYDPFGLAGSGRERLAEFGPRNVAASRSARLGATLAEVLVSWQAVEAATLETFEALRGAELERVVDHPLTRLQLPIGQMLLHMLSHEVHHRGQISGYLRVLGVEQPPLFVD